MAMTFWVGTDLYQFIFDSLNITTVSSFLTTCFGLLCLSVLTQYAQIKLITMKHSRNITKVQASGESSSLLSQKSERMCIFLSQCTLWFTLQECLMYFLMVCTMTYNVYIFASIVIGAGIGYLIFWPHMSVLHNQRIISIIGEKDENASGEPEYSTRVMKDIAKDLIDSLSGDSLESNSEDQNIVIKPRGSSLIIEGGSSNSLLVDLIEESSKSDICHPSKSVQVIHSGGNSSGVLTEVNQEYVIVIHSKPSETTELKEESAISIVEPKSSNDKEP